MVLRVVSPRELAFDPIVCDKLNHYVYALRDPRKNNKIFYVGRGQDNRCFEHTRDAKAPGARSAKSTTIRRIVKAGEVVGIDIIRHGMGSRTAKHVEAALIDALDLTKDGTNQKREHITFGAQSAKEVQIRFGAKPLKSKARLLMVKINSQYLVVIGNNKKNYAKTNKPYFRKYFHHCSFKPQCKYLE